MSIFHAFNINSSGMTAERFRTDIISQNIANVNTTSNGEGEPYTRHIVTFREKGNNFWDYYRKSTDKYIGNGVKVGGVYEDHETEYKMEYDPSNPDADENGYVTYPNVNIVTEMTNMIDASRAYEANATAFEASKAMATRGLTIGQGS